LGENELESERDMHGKVEGKKLVWEGQKKNWGKFDLLMALTLFKKNIYITMF